MFVFTLFLSICLLIQPILMIYFGKYYRDNSHESVNKTTGYRTKMSMKNDDTWKFAHSYWATISGKIGMFLLPIPIIPILFSFFILKSDDKSIGIVGGLVIVLVLIELLSYFLAIYLTERSLKITFDDDGNRR